MDPIAKLYQQKILTEATNDDINRVAKQHPTLDRSVIQHYADTADIKPGKGSRYLDWLVKGHVNGTHSPEDSGRLKDALGDFEKYKGKLEKKDINQYKHVSELEDAVAPHKGIVSKTAANKESTYWENPEHHEKIYDNGKGLKVYHTKTKEASQAIYGGGHTAGGCHSSWCTAARSDRNMFERYSDGGKNPLYQIHTPDGKVYQDEFSGDYSGGLRDATDKSVSRQSLVKEHPDLAKVPAFQGKDISYTSPGPKLDEALHNEIAKGKYDDVLAHPSSKTEHINKIIETPYVDPAVIKKALGHNAADASTVSAAITKSHHAGSDISSAILNHPKFNDDHAKDIIHSEGWTNLKGEFFANKAEPKHIDQAIESGSYSSLDLAARSPAATDDHREKIFEKGQKAAAISSFKSPDLIAKHYDASLAHSVSTNPNTPSHIIEKAYNESKHGDHSLAMHANAPSSVISKHIQNAHFEHVTELLKKQKNVNSEHIDQAFARPHALIQQAAVRHPKASSKIHDAAFSNPSFHGSISVSASAKPEHLSSLASSEHEFIRQNVAENKNTPKETLQTLATDQVKDVADAATKQLKKRK